MKTNKRKLLLGIFIVVALAVASVMDARRRGDAPIIVVTDNSGDLISPS